MSRKRTEDNVVDGEVQRGWKHRRRNTESRRYQPEFGYKVVGVLKDRQGDIRCGAGREDGKNGERKAIAPGPLLFKI